MKYNKKCYRRYEYGLHNTQRNKWELGRFVLLSQLLFRRGREKLKEAKKTVDKRKVMVMIMNKDSETILIVDDEKEIADLLEVYLTKMELMPFGVLKKTI